MLIFSIFFGCLSLKSVHGLDGYPCKEETGDLCTLQDVDTTEFIAIKPNGRTITKIGFENTNLTTFPNHLFSTFTTLTRIDVSKTRLKKLDIIGMQMKLDYLDASRNEISELLINAFSSVPNIVSLYLSRNQIQVLPQNIFNGVPKLQVLDLSHNKIAVIRQDNLFARLAALRIIYLNNNGMATMRMSFTNSTNLQEYDGSHNELKDWSLTFPSNSKVILNLANCGLKNTYSSAADKGELTVDGNTIEFMKITGVVTKVSANYNKIKFIDIDPTLNVDTLELRGNSLYDISNITKVSSIQVLDLSENRIISFEKNAFEKMTSLKYLNLRKTMLTVDSTFLAQQRHLVFLDISDNSIHQFDLRWLKYLLNLQILRLEKNLIAEILNYEDIKEILPNLNSISIARNQFRCKHLWTLLQTFKDLKIGIIVNTDMAEVGNSNLQGISCYDSEGLPELVQKQNRYSLKSAQVNIPEISVNPLELTKNISISMGTLIDSVRKSNEDAIARGIADVQKNMKPEQESSVKMSNMTDSLDKLQNITKTLGTNFEGKLTEVNNNVNQINSQLIKKEESSMNEEIHQWQNGIAASLRQVQVYCILLLVMGIVVTLGIALKDKVFPRRRRNSISTQELVF